MNFSNENLGVICSGGIEFYDKLWGYSLQSNAKNCPSELETVTYLRDR
jgi:hypothetical protein